VLTATRGEWSDLDVMCMTAMHKDPQRRYRTVQGLIRDVDHFLRGEPLDAQPDSLGYRVGKFIRRNARPVMAVAAVGMAGIALVGFYTARLAAARDRALDEAARTRRIQEFMLHLFRGEESGVGPPDTLRVVTLMDRGVREARALDGDPVVQAELYQTLGGLYQQMGLLDRADSLQQAALDRRSALQEGDAAGVAESLVAMGRLRLTQARLEEAEAYARAGLDTAASSLPPDHPLVLEAESALGLVLQEKGDYAGALALQEEVVDRYRGVSPGSAELSGAISDMANTHFYAGEYDAADSLNRLGLEIDRRLYGPDHPNVADGLINLGAVQFQRGRYDLAEARYREALSIMESYYGPDHPETASALTVLGRALNYQGKTEEALGYLRRALEVQLRLFGPIHPDVASTRNDMGLIALASGDLELAAESFRQMAEIYDSVYTGAHWFKGIARSNLAAVYLEAGRYRDAEGLFREAVEIFGEALSPEDTNTAIARIKLGRALLRQERWAEAEEESRAGYETLVTRTEPSVSWLQAARQDLAEAYGALGDTVQARLFREEAAEYAGAGGR